MKSILTCELNLFLATFILFHTTIEDALLCTEKPFASYSDDKISTQLNVAFRDDDDVNQLAARSSVTLTMLLALCVFATSSPFLPICVTFDHFSLFSFLLLLLLLAKDDQVTLFSRHSCLFQ